VLLANDNDSRLWDLLTRSVSSFATLFRHVLIVLGHDAPVGKRAAVQALSTHVQFDSLSFMQVLDVREQKTDRRKFGVKDVFSRYLLALEQVATAVDRMLDSGPVNPA
jgi:hypothetical protein